MVTTGRTQDANSVLMATRNPCQINLNKGLLGLCHEIIFCYADDTQLYVPINKVDDHS